MEKRKLGNSPNGIMSCYHIKPFNVFSLLIEYSPSFWAGGDPCTSLLQACRSAEGSRLTESLAFCTMGLYIYDLLTLIFFLSASYLSLKIKFQNFSDPLHSSLAALENITLPLTCITSMSLCPTPHSKLFEDRDHIFFILHGLPPCFHLIHVSVNTFVFCLLSLMSCDVYLFSRLQRTNYTQPTNY